MIAYSISEKNIFDILTDDNEIHFFVNEFSNIQANDEVCALYDLTNFIIILKIYIFKILIENIQSLIFCRIII